MNESGNNEKITYHEINRNFVFRYYRKSSHHIFQHYKLCQLKSLNLNFIILTYSTLNKTDFKT